MLPTECILKKEALHILLIIPVLPTREILSLPIEEICYQEITSTHNADSIVGLPSKRYEIKEFWIVAIFFKPSPQVMFPWTFETEEGGERETLIHQCKREHQSVASCTCPDRGSNLQPKYVPWRGIESKTLWCMGRCSNRLCHPVRACSAKIFYCLASFCLYFFGLCNTSRQCTPII